MLWLNSSTLSHERRGGFRIGQYEVSEMEHRAVDPLLRGTAKVSEVALTSDCNSGAGQATSEHTVHVTVEIERVCESDPMTSDIPRQPPDAAEDRRGL